MRIKLLLWSTCAMLSMLILCAASQVQAAQVKLAWDAATGSPLGYKLYYGQASRSYQGSIDVGTVTDYTLTGLTDGQQYYFTATAYDAAGNESGYSNEVTTIALPSPPTSIGPVAAYKFDEGKGTTVTDASGLGNHGTIAGATWTGGRYGKALYFDGVSAMVTIPGTSSLNLTAGMTLQAWVHPAGTPKNWRSVMVKEGSGNAPYYLYASSSNARGPAGGGYIGASDQIVYGGTSLPAKTWTHVAITYDGTTQRLYVNGLQVASRAQSGTMPISTGALRIGGNSMWGEYFNGRIDEVRLYNRALTASQIQVDMNTPIVSAVTPNVAARGISGAPAIGMPQPDMKTRVAAILDRMRSATTASLPPHRSAATVKASSQSLDSQHLEVDEVEVDRNWKHIEFNKVFVDPVVIANTLSYRGANPVVVTIRNVVSTGFDIRTQASEDDDATPISETVGYMVVERGQYTLADGTLMEAGVIASDTTKSFGSIAFNKKFNVLPVVITTTTSVDDTDTLALKTQRITVEGFQFSLQHRTPEQFSHSTGTIAYIAWEPSLGSIDNLTFEVKTVPQVNPRQFHNLPFEETFENVPMLFADVQTSKNGNLLNIRWANKDVDGVEVMIDTEDDANLDSSESTAVVGYLVIK